MRPRLLLCGGLAFAAASFAACFPDYQIAGTSSGGTEDGGGGDGTTGGDGDVTADGSSSGSDGSKKDGASGGDGASPFDAAGATLVPGTSGGPAFAYTSPGGTAQSSVAITVDVYFDTAEVTVGRFTAWVDAGKPMPCAAGNCTLDPGGPHEADLQWESSWNLQASDEGYKSTSCNNTDNGFGGSPTYNGTAADVPINCVNWYQAVAFCWWDGQKRLPTEIEWQWEASGRGRGRTYPWGDTPMPTDCTLAIWRNGAGSVDNYNGCKFPLPGGSAPAGKSFDNLLDMAGSVYEWTWDEEWNEYPTQLPNDYAGPPLDGGVYQRISRGGGYTSDERALHADWQNNYSATSHVADIGFRCAKTKL